MINPFLAGGDWYRGNLHTHTTESDGRWSVAECCDYYRDHGYDFLAITDHWKLTDASSCGSDRFLLIRGIELKGYHEERTAQFHVVGLGVREVLDRSVTGSLQATVDAIRAVGGIALVAHPQWSRQTVEHLLGTVDAVGLEIFNAKSELREVAGYATAQWDGLLRNGERWWGFASDDAHQLPGYDDRGRGWVYVRACQLTETAILDALVDGAFWSSTGPVLHHVEAERRGVVAYCSPCASISFVIDGETTTITSPDGAALTEAGAELPDGWRWVRVECYDGSGGIAWSNPLFA